MKSLTSFLKQCIAEVMTEPAPQPVKQMKGLNPLIKHCIAEVIVEPGMTAERLRQRVRKVLEKRVHVVGNPKKFDMSQLVRECTLEVLKERLMEAFDPQSQGPNIPQENPYPAWNAKMAQLEEEGDSWDKYQKGYQAGKADKAAKQKARTGMENVFSVGYHDGYTGNKSSTPDVVRKTIRETHPHGRYAQQAGATPFTAPPDYEENKTFQEIRDREDPQGKKHDLTLECVHCGTTQTCRCSAPKRKFKGCCESCAKVPLKEWSPEDDVISKVKKEVYTTLGRQGFRQLGDEPRDYMEFYMSGFVTVSIFISYDERAAIVERYYDSEMVDNIPGHHVNAKIPIPPQYDPNFVKKLVAVCMKLKNAAAGDESIFGGIDDLQERAPTMEWQCPHCQKKAGIILEVESPTDYVAFADCQHCGKDINDPKLDKAIYEVVMKHYILK